MLKPHWDTFVTLDDFWKIKNAGFNLVRIPVGYWSYVDPWGPYAQGAAPYVDAAIDWARITGLKVVIDLHGAPKSQNGFDHSGHRAPTPGWGDADSLGYTHAALRKIEEKYAVPSMQDVVVAIQILNEPYMIKLDKDMVKSFYRDAYENLRRISDTPVMLHDGFFQPSWMNGFLTLQDNNAQNVIVDHHEYQIFDKDLVAMSVDQHVNMMCNSVSCPISHHTRVLLTSTLRPTTSPALISGPSVRSHSSFPHYLTPSTNNSLLVVGEWSSALTDCAKHLNGFASGSRLDGSYPSTSYVASCTGKSGRVSDWSNEWKDSIRRYIEVQLDAYEAKTQGWIFWNFKTEGSAGDWDLFQLLDGGVFPQPLSERRFGKQCANF